MEDLGLKQDKKLKWHEHILITIFRTCGVIIIFAILLYCAWWVSHYYFKWI